ncbi:hypothetical protein ACN38_g5266 [Penicillium nordicum]|uniref:Uncharacterized protein n=1 Tax=Penicillium nordicum TaxID=229535 RepID=A0A0N0RZ03_9EURO|nr:hypothetical protein ACN38_g5266 [Penicillium nordicum]
MRSANDSPLVRRITYSVHSVVELELGGVAHNRLIFIFFKDLDIFFSLKFKKNIKKKKKKKKDLSAPESLVHH